LLESVEERVAEAIAVLLGWPAIATSVISFVVAIARRSRSFAILGWGLATPVLLYLTMTPRFQYSAPLGWLGLGLAVWNVRVHPVVAVALLIPALGHILLLAYFAVSGE